MKVQASKLKPGNDVRLTGWSHFMRVLKVEKPPQPASVFVTFNSGLTLGLDYFDMVEVKPR